MEKRIKYYQYLTANTLDRREQAEKWRLAGLLEKVSPLLTGEKQSSISKIRFPARGK